MDQLDVMTLHEQYQPPAVGVGEVVLVKFKNRNCWDAGHVMPPQVTTWKPGQALGKRITVYVPKLNRLVEDIVHLGDPLHTNSPEIYSTVWECCVPGKVHNVQGTLVELQAKLTRVAADLDGAQKLISSLTQEVGKLKAVRSFRKEEKELAPAA